jgi:hypothetical protein
MRLLRESARAARLANAIAAILVAAAALGCGGDDDRDARWSYIAPVLIAPNCATASCHSRLAAVAGLDLSTRADAYRSLTSLTLPTPQYAGKSRALVLPGNPGESRVVRMLRADGVARMPPDRPLAEADIALVERWILDGAQND